jgi:uncharacterized membrane protein YgdD (TMEM256/DUF423 family)
MAGRGFIFLGAIFAAIGVALGAMGAHALEEWLTDHPKHNFETAVRYQMVHAIALILVGLAAGRGSTGWLTASGWLFCAGILLFSGGLYGWIFTSVKPFVHIVPVGGTLWIIAWVCFAISQMRAN